MSDISGLTFLTFGPLSDHTNHSPHMSTYGRLLQPYILHVPISVKTHVKTCIIRLIRSTIPWSCNQMIMKFRTFTCMLDVTRPCVEQVFGKKLRLQSQRLTLMWADIKSFLSKIFWSAMKIFDLCEQYRHRGPRPDGAAHLSHAVTFPLQRSWWPGCCKAANLIGIMNLFTFCRLQ